MHDRPVPAGVPALVPDHVGREAADVAGSSAPRSVAGLPTPGADVAADALSDLLARVGPADPDAAAAAAARLATLATPPGALGDLGTLAVRLAASTGTCPPPTFEHATVVVAAGDHGVHAQGVSPWPQAITAVMASTVAEGRAGISAIANAVGAEVVVLDVGIADELPAGVTVHDGRVVAGTRDASLGDALTRAEATAALLAGALTAERAIDDGTQLLVTGDLGIANTTTSAVLVAACSGATAAAATGRGTGVDDRTMVRKVAVVEQVLARLPADVDPLGLLAAVGGAEHAALVGVLLAGAANRVPVVLDGVIAGAAALVAQRLAPHVVDHLVAGHRSTEPGATLALAHLGLEPLLDLHMRLGEGSGAALAVPVVRAASAVLRDVATLADLGVS